MPKLKVNGIDLHYITVGQGSDVVMVHGFLGNLAVWHLQIVPQLRNFYSITTVDLRGHGYSQVTPDGYTAADMANDLKGLLDRLGIEKVSLVGHSYGADVCLYFALLYPERVNKLVALSQVLPRSSRREKMRTGKAGRIGYRNWRKSVLRCRRTRDPIFLTCCN